MSARTIREYARRQAQNVYGKPPKPARCTVQVVDTTTARKSRHVCKLTIYADPLGVEKVIRIALQKIWRQL